MAVEVHIDNYTTSNVSSFSVQEDATPIDPSSSAGGIGQITFGLDSSEDSPLLIGELIITDGARGKTSGAIRSLAETDGKLTITADSVLGRFNTDKTAPPYSGTLGGAVQMYCDLVGITNDVVTDLAVASRPVVYPGWHGNAWVYMKQMLAKEQVEISLVFDRIYVRPLRLLTANTNRQSTSGWNLDNATSAQSIEIYYYNHVSGVNQEVYPVPGTEATIYTVNAGETITVTQQLNASMSSLNQPVVANGVLNQSYAGTTGVYAVAGNDGLPIQASQWLAEGGSLTVALTDDPSVMSITIHGASGTTLAPYRIAMTAGPSNYYNALHITGTGVTWNKKLLTLYTGANDPLNSTDVGATVDNVFISSYSDAINLGIRAAGSYAGNNYTISGSAYALNREGAGRDLIAATIGDFNLAEGFGTPISTFNTEWTGNTIQMFNDYWDNQVTSLFENQIFGNAIGARILKDDANFRISSATTTESVVQFSAQLDTLMSDLNSVWEGATMADFNTQFDGVTFKGYNVIPLRRDS
jgi:hypothetical protein